MWSYSWLLDDSAEPATDSVTVDRSRLMSYLRSILAQIPVDEDWYLAMNEDVREAVRGGQLASAREHYVTAGYFEDRLPRPIEVDASWYLETYPDVREAISRGSVKSPQHHFVHNGFKEGRLAYAGWSLLDGDAKSEGPDTPDSTGPRKAKRGPRFEPKAKAA